jgi:hypothetical protein
MKEIFQEYGGVLITVVAILAVIVVISAVIGTNGTNGAVGKAFTDLIQSFIDQASMSVKSVR